MSAIEADQRQLILGAAGLVALFAAGLVLASSWLVSYPAAVLLAAWLFALAGMVAVLVVAFRQARATKTGFFAALGQSFKALGQFILAFF
jgi:hypothetical protein